MTLAAAAPYIAQGIGGLFKMLGGNSQRNKGRALLNEIGESPDEVIPNEVLQNQAMAKQRANTGLPSEQYAQAMRNLQRQQLATIKNSNDRKAGLSLLAGSEQKMNDAILNLGVTSANARMNNEKTLYGVNNTVGSWKDKVWRNNVKDKWDRKYQYGMSLLGMGNQNKANGTDQLLAGGVGAVSAGLLNGLFKKQYSPSDLQYTRPGGTGDYIPFDDRLIEP